MAIDTMAKRRAALDFEEVWAEGMPAPDGTIGTADRWHLVWGYYLPLLFTGVMELSLEEREMHAGDLWKRRMREGGLGERDIQDASLEVRP